MQRRPKTISSKSKDQLMIASLMRFVWHFLHMLYSLMNE